MMMMNLPVKRVGSGKDSLGKASGLCRSRRPVTAGRTRQIPCVHPPFEALGVVLVAALEPRDLLARVEIHQADGALRVEHLVRKRGLGNRRETQESRRLLALEGPSPLAAPEHVSFA